MIVCCLVVLWFVLCVCVVFMCCVIVFDVCWVFGLFSILVLCCFLSCSCIACLCCVVVLSCFVLCVYFMRVLYGFDLRGL